MMKYVTLFFALCLHVSIAQAAGMPGGMPPMPVEVTTIKLEPWQQHITATGTLVAIRGVILKPEISGRVTKILFTPGQLVKEGDPLVQLNPDILKAQLDSAKAQLALSQVTHERMQSLYKKNTVAKAEVDKSLANFEMDKAKVADAQAKLDQALIRAPFAGRIGLDYVHLGEYVSPGKDLVSLQSMDPMRVDFTVPEVSIGQIALGQTVIVRTSLYPKESFNGKLYEMDSKINPSTRTLAVRASVANPDQKLLPGAFVSVELYLGPKQDVIMIPQAAIVYAESGNYVYKIENNKAIKTIVRLGTRMGDRIVITQGLKVGDLVVYAGQVKLGDGAPAVIVQKDGVPVTPPQTPKGK